jgi:membrane-bound lytic murein transglycosylase D
MVESGYRPTVRSHAGAVGMWQFMPATGRGMGLRIDSLVDERMDPVRATHAAARHLRQLNREFRGDWALAAAAYNAGSGRINRGLGRFNATNFWDLAQRGDLAQETRHYVPRLYAVTIIAKDPARFGYPAPSGPGERFAYDSIRVDLATPLSVLAQAGNLPVQQLVDLNPHMLRQVAPANYFVWVPAGQAASLRQAYADSEFRRRGGFAYYRVRDGDSLQRLADLSGVSPDRIRSLNLSANLDALRPGERLRMFADAARTLNARPVERVARRESREAERDSASTEGRSSTSRSSESRGERSASSDREGRSAESRNASASRSSSERGNSSERSNSAERSTSAERTGERSSSASSTRRTESGESRAGRSASATSRTEGSSSGNSSRNASGSSSRNGGSTASGGASSSRTASAASSPPPRSGSSSTGAAAGRTHKVEDGESLWGIARKYEVTVDAVRAANDMDSETIQPGQTLRIPRASSAAIASTSRPDSARRSTSTSTPASDGERRASSASSGTGRTSSTATGSAERRASASTSGSGERRTGSRADSTASRERRASASAGSGERRTGSRADSSASRERRASASASGSASGERGSSSAESSERRSSTAASGQRANSTASSGRAAESGSRSARRHHTVASGETLWSIARQYNTSVDTLRRANNLAADAQIQPGQRLAIPAAD